MGRGKSPAVCAAHRGPFAGLTTAVALLTVLAPTADAYQRSQVLNKEGTFSMHWTIKEDKKQIDVQIEVELPPGTSPGWVAVGWGQGDSPHSGADYVFGLITSPPEVGYCTFSAADAPSNASGVILPPTDPASFTLQAVMFQTMGQIMLLSFTRPLDSARSPVLPGLQRVVYAAASSRVQLPTGKSGSQMCDRTGLTAGTVHDLDAYGLAGDATVDWYASSDVSPPPSAPIRDCDTSTISIVPHCTGRGCSMYECKTQLAQDPGEPPLELHWGIEHGDTANPFFNFALVGPTKGWAGIAWPADPLAEGQMGPSDGIVAWMDGRTGGIFIVPVVISNNRSVRTAVLQQYMNRSLEVANGITVARFGRKSSNGGSAVLDARARTPMVWARKDSEAFLYHGQGPDWRGSLAVKLWYQVPGSGPDPPPSPWMIAAAAAAGSVAVLLMLQLWLRWLCQRNRKSFSAVGNAAERYMIISKIGGGAKGSVFLVTPRLRGVFGTVRSGRDKYAMKYLECQSDADGERSLQEFALIRKCHHPSVITAVEAFMSWHPQRDQRCVCIVMPYFPEGDLAHQTARLADKGGVSEDSIISYAYQLSDALAYLHALAPPVIHRDIKPENVLVADHGERVVLSDFGLAAVLDRGYAQTHAGTMAYVAPEVGAGGASKYGCPADVWSFGATLLAVALGTCASSDPQPVLFALALSRPTFGDECLRIITARGHATAAPIITDMLKPDPLDRPTAEQLLECLQQYVESCSTPGSATTSGEVYVFPEEPNDTDSAEPLLPTV